MAKTGRKKKGPRCPFCGLRGSFIGGEWKETCEHWVGFDGLFLRTAPRYLLTQGKTFDRFHDLMKAFDKLIPTEWATLIDSAPRDLAQLIDSATTHASSASSLGQLAGAGYWKRYVDFVERYVTLDADDSTSSIRYQNYFTSDPTAAKARLESLVERAIHFMDDRPELKVYPSEVDSKTKNLPEQSNDSEETEDEDPDDVFCPICKLNYYEHGDLECEHFLSSWKFEEFGNWAGDDETLSSFVSTIGEFVETILDHCGEPDEVRDEWLPFHLTRVLRESLDDASFSANAADDYLEHLLKRTSGYAGSAICESDHDTWTTHWAQNGKSSAEQVDQQLLKDIELIRQMTQKICESLGAQAEEDADG